MYTCKLTVVFRLIDISRYYRNQTLIWLVRALRWELERFGGRTFGITGIITDDSYELIWLKHVIAATLCYNGANPVILVLNWDQII